MYVHQIVNETCEMENQEDLETQMVRFRIFVDDDENTVGVIMNWKNPGAFDDLAFQNAVMDKRNVKVREVQRSC